MHFHQFYCRPTWDKMLQANALGTGHAAQLEALPECFLAHLYSNGVAPTVASVIAFCESDPERWKDETESNLVKRGSGRQDYNQIAA